MTDDAYRQLMKHAHRLAMDGHGELAQFLRDAMTNAQRYAWLRDEAPSDWIGWAEERDAAEATAPEVDAAIDRARASQPGGQERSSVGRTDVVAGSSPAASVSPDPTAAHDNRADVIVQPDNSKVICPKCCHQFGAISVDDQDALRREREARERAEAERNALRQHLHDEHQRHIVTMDERDRIAAEVARLDTRNRELCYGWSSQNERAERAEAERDALREYYILSRARPASPEEA